MRQCLINAASGHHVAAEKKAQGHEQNVRRPCAASQLHFHSIIGDSHFNTALGCDAAELRCDFSFVTVDNFRAAMSYYCARYALFLTPRQMGPTWRVTDLRL